MGNQVFRRQALRWTGWVLICGGLLMIGRTIYDYFTEGRRYGLDFNDSMMYSYLFALILFIIIIIGGGLLLKFANKKG